MPQLSGNEPILGLNRGYDTFYLGNMIWFNHGTCIPQIVQE
jgi:hypothetical protein